MNSPSAGLKYRVQLSTHSIVTCPSMSITASFFIVPLRWLDCIRLGGPSASPSTSSFTASSTGPFYRPLKMGLRFSAKARGPSLKSSVSRSGMM